MKRLRAAIKAGVEDFEAGRSADKHEVFAELRALREAKRKKLRQLLDPAIEELERGEVIPGPVAFEQARAELRRRIAQRPDSTD